MGAGLKGVLGALHDPLAQLDSFRRSSETVRYLVNLDDRTLERRDPLTKRLARHYRIIRTMLHTARR